MSKTEENTRDWQERDLAHHVHPFSNPSAFAERGARIIERAEGVYVWDSDGNKILDGMAGLWCVNMGYGRHELIEAATRQLRLLPYYNSFFHTATPSQIDLASNLAQLTPGSLKHFFFANSGSEANDTIIRLIRHYWSILGRPSKRTFIGRTLGYHGSTLAAASLSGMPNMHAMDGTLLPGFAHIEHPHWYLQGAGLNLEEYGIAAAHRLEDKIIEIGSENVAAFVGEPVQGAGGVFDPPPTYWPEIQRICKKYDVLIVADEVICGFGRTGNWFGSDTYRIEPDLMPMAKGLSSGYLPISAVAMCNRFYEVIQTGGVLAHGYTYSGHPVACAVALANIRLMKDESVVDRVRSDIGPYFRARLAELAEHHPIVGEIRGAGLLAALQLVKQRDSRTVFTTEENAAVLCRDVCLENGLIARAVGQSMVLSPPLVIKRAEIDELIEKLRIGLDATANRFGLG